MSIYHNGTASKVKLAESHKRFEQDIEHKNEEKLSRTQELNTAKVQALREAFPAQLGAMYTQEEQSNTIEAEYSIVDTKVEREITENANKETLSMSEEKPEPKTETAKVEETQTTEKPGPELFQAENKVKREF